MIDRVQRRLLLALGASLLLHVWMVRTGDGSGARRVTIADAISPSGAIHATIRGPRNAGISADDTAAPSDRAASQASLQTTPVARHLPAAEPVRTGALVSGASLAPDAAAAAARLAVTPQGLATREGSAMLPQPSDGTYYTARSLDVYPRALTALDLGPQSSTGKARATVLIDESGTVNEVRAIEASAADIATSLRDLLLRTRFTPASKDGQLVKAQLLVSVDYGAADDRR